MASFMEPPLPLIGIAEAARILGVHKETLRRWDRKGELTGVRIGRERRYKFGDIVYKYAFLYLNPKKQGKKGRV